MRIVKCMLALLLCICLCGCELFSGGSHIFVQEHQPSNTAGVSGNVTAENYEQMYDALVKMVESGTTQQVISVERYDADQLESDLQHIFTDLCRNHPIAAYAVAGIEHTIGTVSGSDAVSVQISYLHDKTEIRRIISVADNDGAREIIAQSLTACDTGVVLYIQEFAEADFTQMVEDYALNYPECVMELPQVTVSIYPESGPSRVVELKFAYNTNRESLKNMQNQVSLVFRSAVLYVSGDAAEEEKLSQLYSFLMERYDYTIESSITPAYSLLRHGAGDSRAFATVYAAMCRQAGLTCYVVSGGLEGESRFWNIVSMDGVCYHLDLLASNEAGVYSILTDSQMRELGYLWDFDAYPVCDQPVTPDDPSQTTGPDTPEENSGET